MKNECPSCHFGIIEHMGKRKIGEKVTPPPPGSGFIFPAIEDEYEDYLECTACGKQFTANNAPWYLKYLFIERKFDINRQFPSVGGNVFRGDTLIGKVNARGTIFANETEVGSVDIDGAIYKNKIKIGQVSGNSIIVDRIERAQIQAGGRITVGDIEIGRVENSTTVLAGGAGLLLLILGLSTDIQKTIKRIEDDASRKARIDQGDYLLSMGKHYFRENNIDEAIEYYQDALKIFQLEGERIQEAKALKAIGEARQFSGEPNAAIDSYSKALALTKTDNFWINRTDILRAIGETLYTRNEPNTAMEYYSQALNLSRSIGSRRGEAYALYGIGKIQSFLGQVAAANESFSKALNLIQPYSDAGLDAYTMMISGFLFSYIDHYWQAEEFLKKAIQHYKTDKMPPYAANCYKQLGDNYMWQKRFSKALKAYTESLVRNPTEFTYAARANAYIYLKKYDLASNDIVQAEKLAPDFYFLPVLRSDIAIMTDEVNLAIQLLTSLCEKYPNYSTAQVNLACALGLAGKEREALLAMERGINPQDRIKILRFYINDLDRWARRYKKDSDSLRKIRRMIEEAIVKKGGKKN